MNISTTLDNVIALVVVILMLSLIVQSIQSLFKKLLKVKSRQIEASLVDLFESALNKPPPQPSNLLVKHLNQSPVLRLFFFRPHPVEQAAPQIQELYKAVADKFTQIGRVAQDGKLMLDSLAKDDLLKVLGKVIPNNLLPNFVTDIQNACQQVTALTDSIKKVKQNSSLLSGDSSAKFAAMCEALDPLLNDLQLILKTKSIQKNVDNKIVLVTPEGTEIGQGEIRAELVMSDLINLRQIKLDDVLKLLGEVQAKVQIDIDEALRKNPADQPTVNSFKSLALDLNNMATAIVDLRQKFDAALAPLRAKLVQVEAWYDTIMQSFEERYNRGMKTWSLVISFLLVAYLNANVLQIYSDISSNEVLRIQLLQTGTNSVKTPPSGTPGTESQNDPQQREKQPDVKPSVDEVKNRLQAYTGLGFKPQTWAGTKAWFFDDLLSIKQPEWWPNRKDNLKTLAGWLLMTVLLSLGAPFWHDALESLFGVKGLLRKKADIKNIESESGTGQPKP
jgi:hypothetical protein